MTHIHCINPPGVGVKCPYEEINEQRILRAPAITLSDHRAVYDAKCGRPLGGLVGQMRTAADREEGVGKGVIFLRTSFMDDPLCITKSLSYAKQLTNEIMPVNRLHICTIESRSINYFYQSHFHFNKERF